MKNEKNYDIINKRHYKIRPPNKTRGKDMTKKEYKKARSAVIDYKGTRVLIWLRLFFTLIAFIGSFAIAVLSALQKYTPMNFNSLIDNDFGGAALIIIYYLIFDPISLFSLVYYGAYSCLGVADIFNNANALEWLSFTDIKMSLAVIGFFIVGFILLVISFKALKKTKEGSGGFLWLMIILTLENVACIYVFGFSEMLDGTFIGLWIYFIHAVNIISIIMCARALYCEKYLSDNFENGTSLKLRDINRMYEMDD